MIVYDFDYHRPKDLPEAGALSRREDFKVLAGGMSLIPVLKMRLARYAGIVDLGAVEALKGIRREADSIVIGAMTPHAEVAASEEIARAIPGLNMLASGIGDPLVRNRGTLGGSIANADPAADYPAGLVGLGATVVTDRREIAADAFFTGLFETALEAGEIIREVRVCVPQASAYSKLKQPASRFALVGVFVSRSGAGVRVAVTGAGPSVFRFEAAEAALSKRFDPQALEGITLDSAGLNTDIHATAEYRAHAVTVLTRRSVAKALEQ
jgi:aerobic carbon-monoxide dehydrogenase medium subunit